MNLPIDKVKKKLNKMGAKAKNSRVYGYYQRCPLDPETAVFTSKNGHDLAGNMYRLMIAMHQREDRKIHIVIAAVKEKRDMIQNLLERAGISDAEIVIYDSLKYFSYLESAKYLFCDSSLPLRWVKKEGQVYVNTWHGTPLKKMGNDSRSDRYNIANIQKNFLSADFLVYPSDFCADIMLQAYSVREIYQGNVLCSGYPRNDVFFDAEQRQEVRTVWNLDGKKVFVYMPTFRESAEGHQDSLQLKRVQSYLETLDGQMTEDEVLFVKFHVFVEKGISFSKFRHIQKFPAGIETYEFLNAADGLISDYSSVMYDFANTGRKIIRFVYDEEEYSHNRGFYQQPVEMPFPKVYDAEHLLMEMRSEVTYDDSAFRALYCQFDHAHAADQVIEEVLAFSGDAKRKETTEKEEPNVLLYNESITPGLLTDKMTEMLQGSAGQNWYLSFCKQDMNKHPANFKWIPEESAGEIGLSAASFHTICDSIAFKLFYERRKDCRWIQRHLDLLYEREVRRLFTGFSFDRCVFYLGNRIEFAELFPLLEGTSEIYLFYRLWNCFDIKVWKRILPKYDRIIVPDEDLAERVRKITGNRSEISIQHVL